MKLLAVCAMYQNMGRLDVVKAARKAIKALSSVA